MFSTQFPYLILLACLTLLSTSVMGAVFLVGVSSRRSPTVRTLCVAIPLLAMASVRAFDPIVYFLIQGLVVWIGWHLWQWSQHRADQRRSGGAEPYWPRTFSLRTFLTAVLVAALFLLLLLALRDRSLFVWLNLCLAGGTAGLASLFAVWGACSPDRRWWRVITALIAAALLAVPLVTVDKFLIYFPEFGEAWDAPWGEYNEDSVRWLPVVVGIVAFLMIWFLLANAMFMLNKRHSTPLAESISSWRARFASILLGILSLVALLPSVAGWLALVRGLEMPAAKVASPNGYDELVAAGNLLVWGPALDNAGSATAVQLAAELAKNAEAFAHMRAALTRPSEKHLVGNWDVDGDTEAMDRFRLMSRALAAEGRLAELEGRIDAAAQSYLDIHRLSHAIDRGGLLVDWLVARAVEGIGAYRLAALCPRIPNAQAMKIAESLRLLESRREPFEDVNLRDRAWEDRVYGWPYRLNYALQLAVGRGDNAGFLTSGRRCQAITRLVYLELALKAYQHERGKLPDQLNDLFERKPDEMSLDPFSAGGRGTYIYERRGESYLLYSVGPDGDDDHGALPSDPSMLDGDLSLGFFTQPVSW